MENRQAKLRAAYVLTLTLALALAPLGAQESEAPATPPAASDAASAGVMTPLVEEATRLQDRIAALTAEIRALQAQLADATGEEHLILVRQLDERRLEALDDIHELARNINHQVAQGLDPGDFRAFAQDQLDLVPAVIQRLVDASGDRLAELQRSREDTPSERLTALEQEIDRERRRRSQMFDSYLRHVEVLEEIGLPADEHRSWIGERLRQRAETLADRITIAREALAPIRERTSLDPADAGLQSLLEAAEMRFSSLATALEATIAGMRKLDLDGIARFEARLIEATGRITSEVLDSDVAFGLVGEWSRKSRRWLAERGPTLVFRAVVFLVILLLFRGLAALTRRLLRRALSSSRVEISQLMRSTLLRVSGGAVMVIGLLVALSQIGLSLTPLLAGLGIAGFIVGFALQDTLSNFAAGMMILIYRPYDVGDVVEAAGVTGKVSHMSLVSTTILTFDNQTLVVPNSKIWGDVIRNVTSQETRRVDMTFGISYEDEIPKAERLLREIVEAHPKVLAEPEPVIRLHNLGDSSVDFIVRPWARSDDYWEVHWDITREVKMRFDREGISIPYPQHDVHLYRVGETEPERPAERSEDERPETA